VFITSDGSALPLLMSRSSWSRAKKPSFEVGEISDEDAIEYLKKRGMDQDLAEKVVINITGGLFVMLNDYVSNHQEGMKYDDILRVLNENTHEIIADLKVPVDHMLFQRLVANSRIGTGVARDLGISKDELELLLKKNIIAVHPNLTYTFHDRHVSRWFKERIEKVFRYLIFSLQFITYSFASRSEYFELSSSPSRTCASCVAVLEQYL